MRLLRWIAIRWLCWVGIHKLDRSRRGYVGYYWCERCKDFIDHP